MITFENGVNNVIIAICEDGNVTLDKRVYEQKLGTLASCSKTSEVIEVALDCEKYLKEHYKTTDIVSPTRW
jgi:hypothetical protein